MRASKDAMKFITTSSFADPDAAARKLVEIANAAEAVQDGRIHIELIVQCAVPQRWRHPG